MKTQYALNLYTTKSEDHMVRYYILSGIPDSVLIHNFDDQKMVAIRRVEIGKPINHNVVEIFSAGKVSHLKNFQVIIQDDICVNIIIPSSSCSLEHT